MKQFITVFLAVLLALLLCACGESAGETRILISVIESDGVVVDDNGKWIEPGKNAGFILHLPEGISITGTDFEGDYTIDQNGELAKLLLKDIRRPTHVKLTLTSHARSISYQPNGGGGEAVTVSYDISAHSRPNTAIGTDLFLREGYTLTAWNTEPDGSGTRIGLGSRATVSEEGLILYAQWAKWTDEADFLYTADDNVTIIGYTGQSPDLVIPERIAGKPVAAIASGAFTGVEAQTVVLPKTLQSIGDGAFTGCAMADLLLFDNISDFGDACFDGCENLQTLYINAIEAPYGTLYRRESVYADKVDLLILAQGQPKLVFYGGCSMWYNLDGAEAARQFGDRYRVINMGLNGTVSSLVQMEIMENYLEAGDILLHTPELCSIQQLLTYRNMSSSDDKLWCGLEYNYDLFALVDLRGVSGVFDSFHGYLALKTKEGRYDQQYVDSYGHLYMDATGSIPFERSVQAAELIDEVVLDPNYLRTDRLALLRTFYERYAEKGVRVLVSYSAVNMDALPEEQRDQVPGMDELFRAFLKETEGAELISHLEDYLFSNVDFYDTNYHMLSQAAERNTMLWLRDLEAVLRES